MGALDLAAIGARIRQIRGGQTQQAFADRLGMGRTTIVRYEAGERSPDAEFIASAATVFGVDPLWLLTGRYSGPMVLTAEENALLDNYRAAAESARAALRATSAALAQRPAGGGGERDDADCA